MFLRKVPEDGVKKIRSSDTVPSIESCMLTSTTLPLVVEEVKVPVL